MLLTSLGLKKPEGTDPVNVQDFNDNTDVIERELQSRPKKNGAADEMTVAFTEPAALTELTGGDTLKGLFGKLKLTVKNVISIIKLLGTADISTVGDGTVTGAIGTLNKNLIHLNGLITFRAVYMHSEPYNDCNSLEVGYTGYTYGSTLNSPSTSGGWMVSTLGLNSSYRYQIAVDIYNTVAHRACNNGVWTAWKVLSNP